MVRRKMNRGPFSGGRARSFTLDVPAGLEDLAATEVAEVFGLPATKVHTGPGSLHFHWQGDPYKVRSLKVAEAAYLSLSFDIPRPKALLGDQNFRRLAVTAQELLIDDPFGGYASIFISAAGRQSAVIRRIQLALAGELGLSASEETGDLYLRLRRIPGADSGWEVLMRVGSRPLSTREWRVCNYEGALNGPVARGMVRLSAPAISDVYLNIGCGSGTLIIERLAETSAAAVMGVDWDPVALACAVRNFKAARIDRGCRLLLAEGGRLPLASASVQVVTADLPFGGLIGSHQSNLAYYPLVLSEARRVIRGGGRAVMITHEVKLFDGLLRRLGGWRLLEKRKVSLRGLHPRIYVLTAVD